MDAKTKRSDWRQLVSALTKRLLLEEKLSGLSRLMRRVIRRCLWQIKADAAPMRQRVLQALALQNDYAELRGP